MLLRVELREQNMSENSAKKAQLTHIRLTLHTAKRNRPLMHERKKLEKQKTIISNISLKPVKEKICYQSSRFRSF